jgi:hypothetical protein
MVAETVRLSQHLAIRIRKLAYAPKKLRKQQLRSCLKALRQCLILQRSSWLRLRTAGLVR